MTAQPLRGLRILAVSPLSAYGGFNTSIHRVHALEALGASVAQLDMSAGEVTGRVDRVLNALFQRGVSVPVRDTSGVRARLLGAVARERWDWIWLEKAMMVGRATLAAVRARQPHARLIGFSPDDMHARHNQSRQFLEALPLYTDFITTKSYNVDELQQRGCPHVLNIDNGYEPDVFRPMPVGPSDVDRLGGDIGFIGSHEDERADSMLRLAERGLRVRVWGNGWERLQGKHANLLIENAPVFNDDYARACCAFKINLCFLRKKNRDKQTTRSVEIPACGAFMLAERTQEHQAMFVEGEEAEFFASFDELAEKCERYLRDDAERLAIAARGRERCIRSGYSNLERLRAVVAQLG